MTHEAFSVARIAEAARRIDPAFLHTPHLTCERLSELAGCTLTLKIETINPVRSFKGRGADYFVAKAVDAGATGPFACASAGNFGQGMAYACRARGIHLTVFAANGASPLKVAQMRALGADVVLDGDDFEGAKCAARAWSEKRGARFVEDGREPHISEGAGTIACELLANGNAFDAVIVPVGDGALLTGVGLWIKATSPATRIVGVCSRGAPAVFDSWQRGPGVVVVHDSTDTIADGIAVRAPVDVAVDALHHIVDELLLVDDSSLIEAMRLVHAHAGLLAEPAAVAGLAAILVNPSAFARKRVATVLTGSNVTREELHAWRVCGGPAPTHSGS